MMSCVKIKISRNNANRNMELKVKKLDEDAVLPTRAHATDAGYDLYAGMSYDIRAGDRVQISTKIAMQIPEGYVGLIWDKSGLSHKKGLKVLGGVIDSGYRGEILVGMANISDRSFTMRRGEKVAQLLIQKYKALEVVEVEELEEADRGDAGFGSTGK